MTFQEVGVMGNPSILFCATNAGGAKNLNIIVREASALGLSVMVIASEMTKKYFSSGTLIKNIPMDTASAEDLLNEIKPVALICGTTGELSPEKALTVAAKNLGVRVLAVLDEWYNYRLRFKDEYDQLAYLPDKVCCQDELAYEEAKAQGLPMNALTVTGSPYLADLWGRRNNGFLKCSLFGEGKPRPMIMFLSETHSQDYGEDGAGGPLGGFLGYTEKTVRCDIADVLKSLDFRGTVIEKLHPADMVDREPLPVGRGAWIVVKDEELWSLIMSSDIIIGMRSMTIFETALLEKPVVSYQPNRVGLQECTAVRLGLVKCFENKNDLARWISEKLAGQMDNNILNLELPFLQGNPARRILELAGVI